MCRLHATDPVSVFLAARSRLVDFEPADLEQISEEAGRLEVWLGDVRFNPRFPTPLQQQLAS